MLALFCLQQAFAHTAAGEYPMAAARVMAEQSLSDTVQAGDPPRLPQWPGARPAESPPAETPTPGTHHADSLPSDPSVSPERLPDSLPPHRSVYPGLLPDGLLPDSLLLDSLLLDSMEVLHPLEWEYVVHDELIAMLLHAHRESLNRRIGIPGFRVHLFMDSGNRARLNTQHEQADFEEKHPEVPAYIVYEEPYFKLRVGDFRTRLDARRFLEKIRRDYPAAYIVVDQINFPELD